MATQPVPIRSQPGIKRDGTVFEGENYIDGQWMRFQRGLPRKIWGCRAVTSSIPEKIYGMRVDSINGVQYAHLGGATTLTQILMDNQGIFTGFANRTPTGFANSPDNLWQYVVMYDAVTSKQSLIAHAAPNLAAISSTVETDLYVGELTDSAALTNTTVAPESGGIAGFGPYLFKFGNAGHVGWSVPNTPNDFTGSGSGDGFITGQKIVRGIPTRGNGSGPGGLLWSLDSLIRAQFVGGTPIWAFDELTTESSILSSQSVIEYDGIYYWLGVDRMLLFNGVVREIPNPLNLNWFYDNVNYAQAQKIFSFKVPRFGEIWWCFPFGTSTECNQAIIYNVREGTWYDTTLLGGGRSAGIYTKVYSKPFMVDVDLTATPGYTLWQHETGVDQINGSNVAPIPSSFETAEIAMLTTEQAQDKSLRIARIEPDFVQSGDMTVTIKGRANAKAPVEEGQPLTIFETPQPGNPQTEVVNTKAIRRLMSFKFQSNVANGDYQMGQPLALIEPADGRHTS